MPKWRRPQQAKVERRYFKVADISGDVPASNQPGPSSASLPGPSHAEMEEAATFSQSVEPPKKRHKSRKTEVPFIPLSTHCVDKGMNQRIRNLMSERGIFHTRRTTKITFTQSQPLDRTKTKEEGERRRHSSEESDLDQAGVKESLEICQGISKIKLEDWYPFYDFEHHKRKEEAQDKVEPCKPEPINEDDDEWEETLVYLDLEDIPDVDGLFSSLAPRGGTAASAGNGALSHLEMKIFDLDSKLPVLQLGGKYFAGHWEDTVGTSLFFAKKSDVDEDHDGDSPSSHSYSKPPPNAGTTLKSIVTEPEIPYDPVFGEKYVAGEEGYELVAKSFKVMKARYFPVVNEEIRKDDIIADSDEDCNIREFQIPPRSMVRKYMTKTFDQEAYIQKDLKRRQKIHAKWVVKKKGNTKQRKAKKRKIKLEPEETESFLSDTGGDDGTAIPSTSQF